MLLVACCEMIGVVNTAWSQFPCRGGKLVGYWFYLTGGMKLVSELQTLLFSDFLTYLVSPLSVVMVYLSCM